MGSSIESYIGLLSLSLWKTWEYAEIEEGESKRGPELMGASLLTMTEGIRGRQMGQVSLYNMEEMVMTHGGDSNFEHHTLRGYGGSCFARVILNIKRSM